MGTPAQVTCGDPKSPFGVLSDNGLYLPNNQQETALQYDEDVAADTTCDVMMCVKTEESIITNNVDTSGTITLGPDTLAQSEKYASVIKPDSTQHNKKYIEVDSNCDTCCDVMSSIKPELYVKSEPAADTEKGGSLQGETEAGDHNSLTTRLVDTRHYSEDTKPGFGCDISICIKPDESYGIIFPEVTENIYSPDREVCGTNAMIDTQEKQHSPVINSKDSIPKMSHVRNESRSLSEDCNNMSKLVPSLGDNEYHSKYIKIDYDCDRQDYDVMSAIQSEIYVKSEPALFPDSGWGLYSEPDTNKGVTSNDSTMTRGGHEHNIRYAKSSTVCGIKSYDALLYPSMRDKLGSLSESEQAEHTACDRPYTSTHMKIHSGGRPFKCNVCDNTFADASALTIHIGVHPSEDRPYKCKVCSETFTLITHLSKHLKLHSAGKPDKCEVCDKTFASTSGLKRHMMIHSGERPFQCKVCHKAFRQYGHLTKHTQIHIGGKTHKCKMCDQAFRTSSNLAAHIWIHSVEKPYKCNVCEKAFSQINGLSSHKMIHSGEKPYKCKLCKKAFRSSSKLSYHLKIHSGEKRYKCNVCEKAFLQTNGFSSHKMRHSGEKPFICKLCKKACRKSGNLSNHMKIHSGPFQCKGCSKAYRQSYRQSTHMQIHSREKPFHCKMCRKTFRLSSNLSTHMRIHSGEKPYKCKVCDNVFTTNVGLSSHMKIHSKEKPYPCKVCDKTFSQLSDCTFHMRIHAGERPYKCRVCNKTYTASGHLDTHMRKHSGDI